MGGETNLNKLIREMTPQLNAGEFVFTCIQDGNEINGVDIVGMFKEPEGTTIILERNQADELNLPYTYVASWITLNVHSSLEAVGLTAAFSTELARNNISCNVIAGFYHDHIFIDKKDETKAMEVLTTLSGGMSEGFLSA